MAAVNSIRDFHNQLAGVCSSLEATFRLAGRDFEDIETAARPAMDLFRELLDLGDMIAGPDQVES
jgi:hypothetical protein